MSDVNVSTDTSSTGDVTPESDSGDVAPESKAITQSMKEKFKLKVDGEDFEEELDWNDKDSIRNKLQMAHAAKKRMTEAAEAKKKAYEIVKKFDEDPESMLKRLGPRGREIAEKYLLAQIQDEMLSPEEKEYRSTKAERDQLKKEKEDAEAERTKTASEAKENEYAQNFQTTIITALNKSGLPKTPELVKRMASTMHKNLELGLELTPDDLVAEVRADIQKLVKSIIGDSDGEHLISMFGEDVAKKIRMSDLKKLKEKQSQVYGGGPKAQGASYTPKAEGKPMSIEEWKESVNQRIKD